MFANRARNSFVCLLVVSGALLVFVFVLFARSYPAVLSQVYGSPSVLINSRICTWASEIPPGVHGIKPNSRPSFPLTNAWIKCEAARYGAAPAVMPETLKDAYTMGGRVPLSGWYWDQAYLGGKALFTNWTMELFEKHRKGVRARQIQFSYPATYVYEALDTYAKVAVRSKRGLVIGSEDPWLESFLLEYGAAEVATLEFGTIKSDHPQVITYTPRNFTLSFLHGDIEPFDFAFSFSSIEHDGLGRYGDVLNPVGDIETMAKMLSVVKPGGYFFFAVPCCKDALAWNAHRIYGPLRYAEMFAGWRVVSVLPNDAMAHNTSLFDPTFHPVWVLQNSFGCFGGEPADDISGAFRSFRTD